VLIQVNTSELSLQLKALTIATLIQVRWQAELIRNTEEGFLYAETRDTNRG
jgi:hypothetical protein